MFQGANGILQGFTGGVASSWKCFLWSSMVFRKGFGIYGI